MRILDRTTSAGRICASLLLLGILSAAQAREADDALMTQAQAMADQAGLFCPVSDAREVGSGVQHGRGTNRYGADNSARTSPIEVSCQDGPGFVIMPPHGADPSLPSVSCLEIANPDNRGLRHLQCDLDGNRDPVAGLSALARRAEISCTVTAGRLIAKTPTASFVELACAEAEGFVLTASPLLRSDQTVTALPCLGIAPDHQLHCTLTDHSATWAALRHYIEAQQPSCAVADSRMIGRAAGGQSVFQIACRDGAGFLAQQSDRDQFTALISCQDPSVAGVCQRP